MNDSEWSGFCQSILAIQQSDFMREMEKSPSYARTKSSMGLFDSSALLALVKKFAPKVRVETGGNLGMSSSFILQGMRDAGVQGGSSSVWKSFRAWRLVR